MINQINSKEPVIEINNLSMSFGNNHVIKDLSMTVYPGQIIGYIGPNGAGKSTTVKIMLGLIENYSGAVKIFGKDIKNDPIEYKKRIGYVPELSDLYDSLTAKEYLEFVGSMYGLEKEVVSQRAEEMMEIFGIGDSINSRISSYSKGMRQKVMIIASLIHNPDLLFLDEPINGLDANSVVVFKEILQSLADNGKTIFYSSHIMEVVEKLSDRIILLSNGNISADGSFDDLKNQSYNESLQEIFNSVTGFNNHREIADRFISAMSR